MIIFKNNIFTTNRTNLIVTSKNRKTKRYHRQISHENNIFITNRLNLTVIKNPEKHKVIIDKSLTTVKSLESLYLYNIQLNILL